MPLTPSAIPLACNAYGAVNLPKKLWNYKREKKRIEEYINIYNKERLHSSSDYLTSDETYYKGANNMCYNARVALLGVA